MVDNSIKSAYKESKEEGKAALAWLTKINDFLEQVPANVNTWFANTFKSGEELAQSYVDKQCIWLSNKINRMIEEKRQQVIKTLQDEYGGYLNALSVITVIKQAVTNPLGMIGSFFGVLVGPYAKVIGFLTTLMKEVPRLAANLANIASALPPTPPNPHINFNAFKIKVNSITLGDVMGGGAMPSPDQMFPEVEEKPFGKEAFNESFENAPIADEIANKIKYKESETEDDLFGSNQSSMFDESKGTLMYTADGVYDITDGQMKKIG